MKKGRTLLVCFFIFVFFVLNLAIPPFQSPDEPKHFAAALEFARGPAAKVAIQRDILRLMDRYDWWRLVGIRKPSTLPARFEEIKYLVGSYEVSDYLVLLNNMLLYHFLLGKALALAPSKSTLLAYYLARGLSALLLAAALIVLYATFKLLAGRFAAWCVSGFFFILFLPQFLITSVAVSPDAFCIFLGSVFFYAALSIIGGRKGGFYWARLFAPAIVGALTDKSLFPLLPLSFCVFFFLMTRRNYQKIAVLLVLLSIVSILALYFTTLIFPRSMENVFVIIRNYIFLALPSLKSVFSFDPFNKRFVSMITDSFFLKFGWMSFGPGQIIAWIWRVAVLCSAVGLVVFLGRVFLGKIAGRMKDLAGRTAIHEEKSNQEIRRVSSTASRILAFSFLAFFAQLASIRLAASPGNNYAQGRYLFPVIAPAALLFVLGLKSLFDLFGRGVRASSLRPVLLGLIPSSRGTGIFALKAFLVLEFLLLNFILWNEVIPVFHLTLKSMYPGI
jgi:ABC-type multidrug transport system fused ATPase/permease subunit